jgi:phytoene dehydrogenase-like protein
MIDCIVIGAGHNGLVTAAYLARAGRSVLVLEASDRIGGAAISAEVFPGMGARLSKYSYLVSLLPSSIAEDLAISVPLARRRVASYTPDPIDPSRGLLVPSGDADALAARIEAFTGSAKEAQAWRDFYSRTEAVARVLFPSLTEPLASRADMRQQLDESDWHDFVERPLGEVLEKTFDDDVIRGVVLTDGLIGTFADAHDASLHQNICFLYHVIGQGTGQWDVPVGGMGAITAQLADRVREAGGEIRTGAEVVAIDDDGTCVRVTVREGDQETIHTARTLAANCAPAVLDRLRGRESESIDVPDAGAQVKVNMLLARLPRLRDESVDPKDAFAGTFHINEGYGQLARAYRSADEGTLPSPLPAEIYCHSLSDPSILSEELREAGVQTLTLFGLHTPHELFVDGRYDRDQVLAAVQATLDSVLAEPIADCLMRDANGEPCIEINTTSDLERDLRIPTGNIFHTPLSWPWAESDEEVGTWGVETDSPRIAICGSGAVRGGGVSGIPGHNAAKYLTSVL